MKTILLQLKVPLLAIKHFCLMLKGRFDLNQTLNPS
jgi:hypothetical protein